MFLMNSGVRGRGDSKKSLLSTAKLLTFHLPNSLDRNDSTNSSHCMFMASCHLAAELLIREEEVNSLNYGLLKNKTFISAKWNQKLDRNPNLSTLMTSQLKLLLLHG